MTLKPGAFGFAVGTLLGIIIAVLTMVLLLKGGVVVGPTMNKLGIIWPGFSVSWFGVPLGGLYGFLSGYLSGYLLARIYNQFVDSE